METTSAEAGARLVFAPTVAEMYPNGLGAQEATWVTVEGLTAGLCAADRPTHFRGVTTVVARLFNKVLPDRAYFGEKDYQQLAVIRRMVRDLDFPVEIVGVSIVREPDGLAMSSRNAYLSTEARSQARCLYRGLTAALGAWAEGERDSDTLIGLVRASIDAQPLAAVQYVELVDLDSLTQVSGAIEPGRSVQLAVAARVGETRLIDNIRLPAVRP